MRWGSLRVGSVMLAIAAVAGGLAGWRWYLESGKVGYCRSMADFHAKLAGDCREAAEAPGVTAAEAAEIRLNARIHDLIARKYAAVARNPFLPYPWAPLVTDEEVAAILEDGEVP